MRSVSLAILLLAAALSHSAFAADELPVQQFLRTGQLAQGEQALTLALATKPDDDQARFSLAVVQLVRGVERLGQGLYQYGCRSESTNAPILRLPVPTNPDPSPITLADFRRLLDAFRLDLAQAEATLAAIKSDDVKLPLKLAEIRLDLVGEGTAGERFDVLLKRVLPRGVRLPEDPEFLVCFDRGDVAWLRAYCHLLMSIIDVQFAVEVDAEQWLSREFAEWKRVPRKRPAEGEIDVIDPVRLRRFREHMVRVCELNRETWAFIQKETDNDHEWLPNPQQTGVLGLPVRREMVEVWAAVMAELEALLKGEKTLPRNLLGGDPGKNLNLRLWLDEPPASFPNSFAKVREKYVDEKLPTIDTGVFIAAFFAFGDPTFFGFYAVYFN